MGLFIFDFTYSKLLYRVSSNRQTALKGFKFLMEKFIYDPKTDGYDVNMIEGCKQLTRMQSKWICLFKKIFSEQVYRWGNKNSTQAAILFKGAICVQFCFYYSERMLFRYMLWSQIESHTDARV